MKNSKEGRDSLCQAGPDRGEFCGEHLIFSPRNRWDISGQRVGDGGTGLCKAQGQQKQGLWWWCGEG